MGFNLPADGGTVFANVPGNLCHFEPLLKSGLDRQSVVIGKVLLAHRYLQSEGRTETTIPEDDIKRNHEVTGATPWLLSHTILSATDDVAFRFSINHKKIHSSIIQTRQVISNTKHIYLVFFHIFALFLCFFPTTQRLWIF